MCVCFIDLAKAFDKGLLTDVLKLLAKRNINQHILAVIKELNTNNTMYIKTINCLTNKIPVLSGVK